VSATHPHGAMQRERVPEIAVRQCDEVEPVLFGNGLIEPELLDELVARDLVYVLARRLPHVSRREIEIR